MNSDIGGYVVPSEFADRLKNELVSVWIGKARKIKLNRDRSGSIDCENCYRSIPICGLVGHEVSCDSCGHTSSTIYKEMYELGLERGTISANESLFEFTQRFKKSNENKPKLFGYPIVNK